jgi:hypothetical protein
MRTIDSSISEKAEYLLFILYFEVLIVLLSPELVIGDNLHLKKRLPPPPQVCREFFYIFNC